MSNVLNTAKREQVIALGRLGWPLRRIEEATGVRRETASRYLRAAGVAIRGPGRWGHGAKAAKEASTDSGDAKPASGVVSTDSAAGAKAAKEASTDSASVWPPVAVGCSKYPQQQGAQQLPPAVPTAARYMRVQGFEPGRQLLETPHRPWHGSGAADDRPAPGAPATRN